MVRNLFALWTLLTLVAVTAPAHAATRDMVREAEIEKQLAALDASLVEPFRAARIAADKDDFVTAEKLLIPICERLPKFDAAWRRLGTAQAGQGRTAQGRANVQKAVDLNRSAANLSTLAYVIAFAKHGEVTDREREYALGLLGECRPLPDGEDVSNLSMTAQLALGLDRRNEAREAIRLLRAKAPDEMVTHYFAAILAAVDEHWIEARNEIRRAEKLGLSHEAVEKFLDSGVGSRATTWWLIGTAAWSTALWAVGLVLLFILGVVLSRATLRQIERADPTVSVSRGEQRLRRIYRAVLNGAGVYYYISLPVVLVLVIGLVAVALFACLAAGFIPIKLMLILGLGAVVTIWSMIQSLFLRVQSVPPGRALERAEAEGLWRLTDEVAADLQTRPIDEIRITPGTDLCVYEQGTWRDKLNNRARRVLVLGAAVLNDFKQEDFRSVLAHEYGHFSHRDTAGGDVAMRVRNDMFKFYLAMAEAGQATVMNIAFHFLRMYHFLFRRISHGATRLQEVLADRVAAQMYGAAAFEGGLRHVIERSVRFDAHANQEIKSAIEAKRPLQNLYSPQPVTGETLESKIAEQLNRPTTEDDTHPGPQDRFRLVAKVPAPNRPPLPGVVWELFRDHEAIQREMTETVEKNIAPHRG